MLPGVVAAQGEPFGSTSIVAQWFVMRLRHDAGTEGDARRPGRRRDARRVRATTRSYRFADLLARGRLATLGRELRIELRRAPAALLAGARHAAALPRTRPLGGCGRARDRADLLVHPACEARAHAAGAAGRSQRCPTGCAASTTSSSPSVACPSCCATRTATRWPTRSRRASRSSTTASSSSLYGLPADQLTRGTTKRVLRRALADLLPPEVRDRRDKLGFVTPEQRFLAGALGRFGASGPRRPRAARDRGLVDVDEALRRLAAGTSARPVWRAVSVELWAQTFLDESTPSRG